MKTENYKGITIFRDPKKHEFYTQVVIRTTSSGKPQYTKAKTPERVRMEIDRFLALCDRKKSHREVWVTGEYQDSRYYKAEILFQDKSAKIITVRMKTGRIRTISLSEHKYDNAKVFVDSTVNMKTIERMENYQLEIEQRRSDRAVLKDMLKPFTANLIR